MDSPSHPFLVSSSPHDHSGSSVRRIMFDVALALLPACAAALWFFRLKAALLLVVCVGTALATEALCRLAMGRRQTLSDGSALVTGMLLALNLPPDLPLWQAALGAVVAIAIAKQLFGGLGRNPFNPALVGRAFLLISFTAAMTTWSPSDWRRDADSPGVRESESAEVRESGSAGVRESGSAEVRESGSAEVRESDALTTATPLGASKEFFKQARGKEDAGRPFVYDAALRRRMFLGNINGSIGETSALALLLGALYLLLRRVITWHVPVAYLGTVAAFAAIAHAISPATTMPADFHLLAGGLLIGALFMATDMVTTPVTRPGLLVFGVGCGLLTMIFRTVPSGAYPEGVSFAILIMNATTPLINRATRPRAYGAKRR